MSVSWKAARSGKWQDANRWSGGVPAADAEVVIDAVGAYTVSITTVASARTLRISGQGVVVEEAAAGTLAVGGRIMVEDGAVLTLLGTNPDLAHGVTVSDATLHLGGTAALGSARLAVAGASTLLLDGPVDFGGRVKLGSENGQAALISLQGANHADLTFSGTLVIASDLLFGEDKVPTSVAEMVFAPTRAAVSGSHTLEVGTGKTLLLGSRAGAALFDMSNDRLTLGLKLDFGAVLDLSGHSLSVGAITTDDYSFIVNQDQRVTMIFAKPGSDIEGTIRGRISLAIQADTALPGSIDLSRQTGIVIGDRVDVELGRVSTRHGDLTVGDDAQVQGGNLSIGASVAIGARTHFETLSLGVRGDLNVGEDASLVTDGDGGESGGLGVFGDVVLAAGSSLTVNSATLYHLAGSGDLTFDGTPGAWYERRGTLSLYEMNGYSGALSITGGDATLALSGSTLPNLAITDASVGISGIGRITFDLSVKDAHLVFTDVTLAGKTTIAGEVGLSGMSIILDPAAGSSFAGATLGGWVDVTLASARAADLLGRATVSTFRSIEVNGHDLILNGFSRGEIVNDTDHLTKLTLRGDVSGSQGVGVTGKLDVLVDGSGYKLGGQAHSIDVVASGALRMVGLDTPVSLASSAAVDLAMDASQSASPHILGFNANDSFRLLGEAENTTYEFYYDERHHALKLTISYLSGGYITQTLHIDGDHTSDDFTIVKDGYDLVIALQGHEGVGPIGDLRPFAVSDSGPGPSFDHHPAPLPPVDLAVLA